MEYVKISGETMGTYYNITCQLSADHSVSRLKDQIDSLLIDINDDVSTYIPTSVISQLNQSSRDFTFSSKEIHFIRNLEASVDLYELTSGFFDPSVMPLVNYWGFGYTPKKAVEAADSVYIDSIMTFVGLDHIGYRIGNQECIISDFTGQLDFSGIAKGYAVDQIGLLLSTLGSDNYMIEIGGELALKGLNSKGELWMIGINTPSSDAQLTDVIEYLSLSNVGLASSGNYRNYHEINGAKYGHTINPHTGYPEMNSLLAVSVVAPDCMTADALATACMTMGFERAIELVDNISGVSACFFVGNADGKIVKIYSNGFIQYVAE